MEKKKKALGENYEYIHDDYILKAKCCIGLGKGEEGL